MTRHKRLVHYSRDNGIVFAVIDYQASADVACRSDVGRRRSSGWHWRYQLDLQQYHLVTHQAHRSFSLRHKDLHAAETGISPDGNFFAHLLMNVHGDINNFSRSATLALYLVQRLLLLWRRHRNPLRRASPSVQFAARAGCSPSTSSLAHDATGHQMGVVWRTVFCAKRICHSTSSCSLFLPSDVSVW